METVPLYFFLPKCIYMNQTELEENRRIERRQIWERRSRACRNPLKKWYLQLLAKRLKNYELKLLNQYDGIAAITHRDANCFKELGCRIPMAEIPIGINFRKDRDFNEDKGAIDSPQLFHLASMDWMPNREAIDWFLEKVWPKVYESHPQLQLFLAGNNMPDHLINTQLNNVHAEGYIKDAQICVNIRHICVNMYKCA